MALELFEVMGIAGISPADAARIVAIAAEYESDGVRVNDIDAAMDLINEIAKGNGVESITSEADTWDSYFGNHVGTYVNMGDTYATTVIVDRDGVFTVGSWGDFLEALENRSKTSL